MPPRRPTVFRRHPPTTRIGVMKHSGLLRVTTPTRDAYTSRPSYACRHIAGPHANARIMALPPTCPASRRYIDAQCPHPLGGLGRVSVAVARRIGNRTGVVEPRVGHHHERGDAVRAAGRSQQTLIRQIGLLPQVVGTPIRRAALTLLQSRPTGRESTAPITTRSVCSPSLVRWSRCCFSRSPSRSSSAVGSWCRLRWPQSRASGSLGRAVNRPAASLAVVRGAWSCSGCGSRPRCRRG